jgi:hypothetical protein
MIYHLLRMNCKKASSSSFVQGLGFLGQQRGQQWPSTSSSFSFSSFFGFILDLPESLQNELEMFRPLQLEPEGSIQGWFLMLSFHS